MDCKNIFPAQQLIALFFCLFWAENIQNIQKRKYTNVRPTVHIVGCVQATRSWVMLWYNWTYMVVIGKKLQTNENLKRYSYQAQTGT